MENVLPPTRVLILEPPSLSQQVQRASLAPAAGLEVVGAVTGAEEALALISADVPGQGEVARELGAHAVLAKAEPREMLLQALRQRRET